MPLYILGELLPGDGEGVLMVSASVGLWDAAMNRMVNRVTRFDLPVKPYADLSPLVIDHLDQNRQSALASRLSDRRRG